MPPPSPPSASRSWNNDNPAASYASLLPGWLGHLTLIAIFIGALSANCGQPLLQRAVVRRHGRSAAHGVARAAIAVVIGLVGLGRRAGRAARHHRRSANFLLVTAYWIGPWLGVVLADRLLRRVPGDAVPVLTDRSHRNWAGPIAMTVAAVVSIALFCNQTAYVGLLVRRVPAASATSPSRSASQLAFALYAVLRPRLAR